MCRTINHYVLVISATQARPELPKLREYFHIVITVQYSLKEFVRLTGLVGKWFLTESHGPAGKRVFFLRVCVQASNLTSLWDSTVHYCDIIFKNRVRHQVFISYICTTNYNYTSYFGSLLKSTLTTRNVLLVWWRAYFCCSESAKRE